MNDAADRCARTMFESLRAGNLFLRFPTAVLHDDLFLESARRWKHRVAGVMPCALQAGRFFRNRVMLVRP